MSIEDEKQPLTKDQRYYRKNRERRLLEKSIWQSKNRDKKLLYSRKYQNSIKGYITTRKYKLNARRKEIVIKLKELENVE